jgi:hypothetical protein
MVKCPTQCPMDWMIDHNLRLRKVENLTPRERDEAARVILRVAAIVRCTVAELAESFSKPRNR